MRYMALLRNLRNFDEAGISRVAAHNVAAKLMDPSEVEKSRQLPFRFFSAYNATMNTRWSPALEDAMQHSLRNVPQLPGRTLILVDVSGSMDAAISAKSVVKRYEIGAVFAAGVFAQSHADLVAFGTDSVRLPIPGTASPLRVAHELARAQSQYNIGHGTNIFSAIRQHYAGHDRVVVFTDEQGQDTTRDGLADVPVPLIYTWNLAGYAPSAFRAGESGRHTFGGFTDAAFRMLPMLERGRHADWPF